MAYGSGLIQPSLDTLQGSATGQTFLWDNTQNAWTVDYPIGIMYNKKLIGSRKYLSFAGSSVIAVTDDPTNDRIVVNVGNKQGHAHASASYILLDNSGTTGYTNYRIMTGSDTIDLGDSGATKNLYIDVKPDSCLQKVEIIKNSDNGVIYARKRLNFIGPVTIADDATNNRCNITITAPAATPKYVTVDQVSDPANARQMVAGTGITLTEDSTAKTITLAVSSSNNNAIQIAKDGTTVGSETVLNFTGSGITSVTDNTSDKRIDITISGGGGGGGDSATATGGSSNRTLSDHYNDVISVKDFGAIDSSTEDSSSAFQSALTYASNNGNKRIFVPAGTYIVTNVNFSGGTLFGDITGSKIICADSTKSVFNISGISAIYGITFACSTDAYTKITDDTSTTHVPILQNVTNATNLLIESCICLGTYGFLSMISVSDLVMDGCQIFTYSDAVSLTNLNKVDIRNTKITSEVYDSNTKINTNAQANATAYYLEKCHNVSILNVVTEAYLQAYSFKYVVVSPNTSYKNSVFISNSQIYSCQRGIYFLTSNNNVSLTVTIRGNRFRIYNSADLHLETVNGNDYTGAIVFDNDGTAATPIPLNMRVVVDANQFEYATNYFILCQADVYLVVSNNQFLNWSGNPKYMKLASSIAPFAPGTKDTTQSYNISRYAINIAGGSGGDFQSHVISKNIFDNSYRTGTAIYIQKSYNAIVSDNILRNTNMKFDDGITNFVSVANNIVTSQNPDAVGPTPVNSQLFPIVWASVAVAAKGHLSNNCFDMQNLTNLSKTYIYGYQTSTFSTFSSTSPSRVSFDTIYYDFLREYSTSTNVITITRAGLYLVSWQLTHDATVTVGDVWNIDVDYGPAGTLASIATLYAVKSAVENTVSASTVVWVKNSGHTIQFAVKRVSGSGNFQTKQPSSLTVTQLS